MWWLISLHDKGVRYGLLTGKEYVVGRKEGDIVVPADQSMSRKHAVLAVLHPEPNIGHPERVPVLHLTDTSKLGTMLADDRFRGTTRPVPSGSQILFGTGGESKFRAEYEASVMTTSCIDTSAKRNLRPLVTKLGAHLVADWRKNCSLLIMSNISVTIKVICALVSQKPIVTPQYLEELMTAVKAKAKLPEPSDYIPMLAESQVNSSEVSFVQNPARENLFQGKIFIFLSPKQFKKLSVAVTLAGGLPMLFEEDSDDGMEDLLTVGHACVMQPPAEHTTMSQIAMEWTEKVKQIINKKGLRFIQDSELGYAVLYASTERYCNPTVDPDEVHGHAAPSQSMSQMQPTVQQTPSQRQPAVTVKKEKSSTQSTSLPETRKKRSREDSGDDIPDQPSAKLQRRPNVAEVIEVKPEPVAAGPSRQERKPSHSPAPPSPDPRISQRKKSPAPNGSRSPSPAPRTRQQKSPAPDQDGGRSPSPTPRTRRQKSPAPKTTATFTKPSSSSKPSIPDEKSPNKSPKAKEVTKTPKAAPQRKTRVEIPDEFDDFDFDSVPTRRNKGKGKGKSNDLAKALDVVEDVGVEVDADIVAGADGDGFDSVPSRRGKKRRTNDSGDNDNDETAAVKQATKQQKPEVDNAAEIDLFDEDIPSTRKQKGKGKKSTSEVVDNDDDSVSSPRKKRAGKKASDVDAEEIDLFNDDDVPSSSSKTTQQRKKENIKKEDVDLFDEIPTRRSRREVKEDNVTEERKWTSEEREESSVVPDEFDFVPSRRKAKRDATQVDGGHLEKDIKLDTNKNAKKAQALAPYVPVPSSQATSIDNTGFLSTKRPMKDQSGAAHEAIVPETEVIGGIEVIEVSLVARRPGNQQKKTTAQSNVWKGTTVKNFKRFRKMGGIGQGLPRIIGGSDLTVHDNKPRKELDEWLREATQAEEQYSQAEREANALFDWQPTKKKGRR